MRWLPLLVLGSLAACDASEGGLAERAAMPVAAAGPAPTPTLLMSPMAAGVDFTMSVEGMPPGAEVWFVLSVNGEGPGPCHPVYGVCASIQGPMVITGRSTVGADGIALVTRPVPANQDRRLIGAQALVADPLTGEAAFSPVVVRLVGDLDLDRVHDDDDNCIYASNADQLDADGDDWGAACDCDDDDAAVALDAMPETADGGPQQCGVASTAASFVGVANFRFTLFGFAVHSCATPVSMDYDDAMTPGIVSTASCSVSSLGLPVVFDVLGEVDSSGQITGTLDDGAGNVTPWTGAISGAAPSRQVNGSASGRVAIGPFTMSMLATEI
jgi:hypothetical protein